MAINDNSGNVGNIAADVLQSQPQQQQQRQQPQRPANEQWSFHSTGLFSSPISRGVGSEFYSKLKTSLTEIYKTANENVEIALIDLDNVNESALAFSSIIVAMRHKGQQTGVAYHLLVLEATGEKITPIFDNMNGQQIEIFRVTSDALDDVLLLRAKEKVQKAFPNNDVYMVDGCVVPTNFNPDDKYAVHRLALNAGLACGVELEMHTKGFVDLNLAHMSHDSTMLINIGFNRHQVEDAVGAPMRSDVLINFASKKNSGQNTKYSSVNSGDKEVKVSELSGYLDLIWNPVAPMGAMNPWMPNQPMQTQKYSARMIITNLASNFSCTPGSILLALATALSLRDDNNWIQAFRPMPSGNEIDLGDIGALNIEANLTNEQNGFGTRIDTKSDSFKLEDLGQLVAALIQPGLIMSLDCPEVGPQSWYLSVFAAASNGSNSAYQVIWQAANRLTNGAFEKYFPNGTTMFVDLNNRVHLGTWTDRMGNKRDIRDIDHLAVCNLVGERNPQLIRDWSDTFLRTQYPLQQRLAARKKMISGFTNETAVFNGFAQRVTFSAQFMEALAKGIKETGLGVRVNSPLTGSDFNNQRGVGNFANSALLMPGQSFMTQGGFSYGPQFTNPGNYGAYRW